MRYRVEQLASAARVSVDTVRYYQSLGLLAGPEREGRVAIYGEEHLNRIRRIRDLQSKGLSLAAIGRFVGDGTDADLASAVAAELGEGEPTATFDLATFAEHAGVPASLIEAVEREGIRIGRRVDGEMRYASGDLDVVRTALRLLEFGLPLADLLTLARDADGAMRGLAERAVDLFDDHVRTPIRATTGEDPEAETQVVDAFRELLPAVTALVSHHFRRVLLETAEDRIGS